ncbi:hypothetical protein FZ934_13540 [Rhizobium grahamii]|uniref:Uncharacterized protein n=1 Tax=Rhizobium grahamii TaxID=1120045 RepID=A0A5Q0C762_9HYPH|nr:MULTISPECIES: hypothetical protein [Rhizobium]QFY61332.1 hypothetical protein FZ934_13540 [Rhizobium grahamii]
MVTTVIWSKSSPTVSEHLILRRILERASYVTADMHSLEGPDERAEQSVIRRVKTATIETTNKHRLAGVAPIKGDYDVV